jgi:hypothetical protein
MLVVKLTEIPCQFDYSLFRYLPHLLRRGLVLDEIGHGVDMQIRQNLIYWHGVIDGTWTWNFWREFYREMQSPKQLWPPLGAQRNVFVHNIILSYVVLFADLL